MKEAMATGKAFAATHSEYIVLLKNIVATLNDYSLGEAIEASYQGLSRSPP